MGRRPCCSKQGLNRGAWTAMEDQILKDYIKAHGEGQWRDLPVRAGLKRCGKSCRLRWLNYLRPDIKRGNITHDEEELIIRLHNLLGNRWSLIAGRLPGRTDNEIKNYWNTNICKKLQAAQQTLSSRNNEASNENAKKSQKKTNIATMKQPSFSNSMVIRTKASRCTKVFIDVPAESPPQLQHTNPSDDQPKSSSSSEEDDNAMNNFMINLEVDENFLSQILNSDFFIDNDMGNKADLGEYNSTVTCDSSTNSDESLLFFSDELIQEMASLIESDFVGGA